MFWFKLALGLLLAWKIFWYIAYVISVATDEYRYYAKMKWSMVKKLYPINPDKWTYDDDPYHNFSACNKMMGNLRYDKSPIMLSFIGYQQLRFNYTMYGIKYGRTKNKEVLESILKDVQKDIERKKKEAQRQIEEAERIMKGVCSNGENH